MEIKFSGGPVKFSLIIPCYNEQRTLQECIARVLKISSSDITLEVIIVDDASQDDSLKIARELSKKHEEITVLTHEKNQGKGASLRTGFSKASGDFVAVQDADLEYDPSEFKKLLEPLIAGEADVVFGSRFLSSGRHRVFYFWHYMGNRLLTFLSNMFTDLNLTDMETCYKVFRADILKKITIEENRFGFEPEIVAKVAHMRLKIFEIGISYSGRTYEAGKKIGARDGFRALYCIFRYNAHTAPLPIQFLFYIFIGGTAAFANALIFSILLGSGSTVTVAAPTAYILAAVINYILCVTLLFKHNAKWSSFNEILLFILVVFTVGLLDLWLTKAFIGVGILPLLSKIFASMIGLVFNFLGRRFFVFPEPSSGPWKS